MANLENKDSSTEAPRSPSACEGDLAALTRRLQEQENQLFLNELRLRELQARLDAMQNSYSWKVSAPLRWALDGLVRVKGVLANIRSAVGMHLPPLRIPLPEEMKSEIQLYDAWMDVNRWNLKREERLRRRIGEMATMPLLSVIMPVYDPPVEYLNRAIESVCSQVYGNWELCIADDASTNGEVRTALMRWGETDNRIKVFYRGTNGNISAATNSAATLATGSHLVFLDQDDELTPDALGEIALYIAGNPETDILYSDDDKMDTEGRRYAPQFKPDWSPELLLSYMYFSHVFVVSRALFEELDGARIGFEGSQDYDLALRASEKARHVAQIPLVLYHWRVLPGSTASSAQAKPDSIDAGRRALQDALSRRGMQAEAYQPPWAKEAGVGIFSHKFSLQEHPPVTIIIPTKNQSGVLKRCVKSILEKTGYPNYEILIIDNDSTEPKSMRYLQRISAMDRISVLRVSNPGESFNFAYINNRAAKAAKSDYILFLDNGTEVQGSEWLTQMVGYAMLPGAGAVGARLLYPDGKIQHAGVLLKFYNGMAGHAFKGLEERDTGYLAYPKVLRNYSAVTAACMLTQRRLFLDMGGFDEQDFKVAYNDVDYCCRLLESGRRVIYTPEAELIHHEGFSRGFSDDPVEDVNFKRKYGHTVDRFYSPSLSLDNEYFEVRPRSVFTGDVHGPVKTLMCCHNLNHEGAPYSQYEMTAGLKERGVIDPVVFSPLDGPLRALYESKGIRVIVDAALCNTFEPEKYQELVEAFALFIRKLGVDMVYANTIITFHAIAAARRVGLPSIWNIRESEPWQHYKSAWGAEMAEEAAECFHYPYKVVFVAHTTRRLYREFEGKQNFRVIYNGLNLERIYAAAGKFDRDAVRRELGVREGELALLLPGTICERKGQHDLVLAMTGLSAGSLGRIRCFIVGEWENPTPYNLELRAIIEKMPEDAQSRVSLLPVTAEIFKYYKAADIFVCTSRIESFPRVILEAMAFDLPIVTTPVFGIQEQVREGINALYYKPGDVKGLAKALEKLIRDDVVRKRFAANSVHVLGRLENFDEMVSAYAGLFKEGCLSTGPRPWMSEGLHMLGKPIDAPVYPVRKVSFLTTYKDENSRRFRVYNIVEELARLGIESAVIREDFAGSLDAILDSDLLVLFRAGLSENVRRIIGEFKKTGVPVVFDLDDLVIEPESSHLMYGLSTLSDTDRRKAVEGMRLLREALLACDFATCTTSSLAKRIESLGKPCFVIPNTINRAQFELAQEIRRSGRPNDGRKVRIAYFSGTRTHEKDFMEVSGALLDIMNRHHEVELHLVGILDLGRKFAALEERIVRQPLMDYLEMLRYLAGMDINLAPLEMDNLFTACKSELKIFEAGLLGVPTVASATDSYAGCIRDGVNGFLAASKEEWVEKLERLIADPLLRSRIGAQAEQDFVNRYYVGNVIKDVLTIYTEICGTDGVV